MRYVVDITGILSVIINESQLFGIYVILALGLNLEYGFTGVPNFGKVFFYGLGAFITGGTVAHIINWLATSSTEICSASAVVTRASFVFTSPGLVSGILLLAIVISTVVAGMFGYLLSYPALRLREDYLGILLIASGELLRALMRALPSNWIACGSDSLGGIPSPFLFLRNFAPPFAPAFAAPFDWVDAPTLVNGSFALLILTIGVVCYLIVTRLSNSPYGRMLKSVRDDEPAAVSLGKDPAKARGQVMIIGSAMAGIAGTLFAFKLQSVDTTSFITLLTFIVWAIMLLGGVANNRGIILGSIVYVSIDFLTFLGKIWAVTNIPQFSVLLTRAPLDSYAQQFALGAIIILVVLFRPQGILREKPIKTSAWDVLKNGSDSKDKQSN